MNRLYYGDNLDILRLYVKDESVDLIYLDPPFNSNATYNVLFEDKAGQKSAAQIQAFEDTWHWSQDESQRVLFELVNAGDELSVVIESLHRFLGTNDMMAYLVMMAVRLKELRRVLKPSGSIYLHCDPTASHYLKLILDAVFGVAYFRNEIIWKRTSSHNDSKRWAHIHDTVFFYAGSKFTWNPVFVEHSEEYLKKFYRYSDKNGRYRQHEIIRTASMGPRPNLAYEYKGYTPEWGWRMKREKLEKLDARGELIWGDSGRPYRKVYLPKEGTIVSSMWTDIPPLSGQAAEKLSYPTQKPEALLERIITASSNKGDVVLDPFCGCGTAIAVAQKLDRTWIGIDITRLAITLIKYRLANAYPGEGAVTYEVTGEPTTVDEAGALAAEEPYHFQEWALGLVHARPTKLKKGADKGIDGRLAFQDGKLFKTILFSVKGGKTDVKDVRDLRGVIEREKAAIGALICLQTPTKPMRDEAASASFYESDWGTFPRIQILTIEGLMSGKQRLECPPTNITFRKAPKAKKSDAEKQPLDFGPDETDDDFEDDDELDD